MKISCVIPSALLLCFALLNVSPVLCEDYISDIDAVRTSMTQLGSKLPEAIRSAEPQYTRTLERVFEINNYALVTIESYLKMLKIYSLAGGYGHDEVVKILNNWLSFIISYCASDIKYLETAAGEIKDDTVRAIIDEEKENIARLLNAASKGVDENIKVFGQ